MTGQPFLAGQSARNRQPIRIGQLVRIWQSVHNRTAGSRRGGSRKAPRSRGSGPRSNGRPASFRGYGSSQWAVRTQRIGGIVKPELVPCGVYVRGGRRTGPVRTLGFRESDGQVSSNAALAGRPATNGREFSLLNHPPVHGVAVGAGDSNAPPPATSGVKAMLACT